ncbi:hypothetical protein GWI33_016171 [Rhynchophorus ferrugineus]|uniref:Uncharacterized protein n=1 Tax=Rhynchophorus ferrugineus TaxID=354439 RepID=A0A834IBM1_RHYFE|nr:hypothetical protein GWI33_016171 [Rhynchophorus ferrugineus]
MAETGPATAGLPYSLVVQSAARLESCVFLDSASQSDRVFEAASVRFVSPLIFFSFIRGTASVVLISEIVQCVGVVSQLSRRITNGFSTKGMKNRHTNFL